MTPGLRVVRPLLLALAVMTAAAAGCGVKTHPFPEPVTLPSQVGDLSQNLDERGHLWLSWSAPARNVNGGDLRTLDHFEVWGAVYDSRDFCDGCPVSTAKIDDVWLQPPGPGRSIFPGPYVWQTDLTPGRVYIFRVAGFSSRGAVHPRAWSETRVWMVEPPGELRGFGARAEDLAVRLRWPEPPAGLLVQVQKRGGDGEYANLDPARDGQTDLAVAYENDYYYRARLVDRRGGEGGQSLVPGPWTDEIRLRVRDTLPPAPPPFLSAALAPGGVRLSWQDRRESGGVAGFYLYRSEVGADNFVRLGGLIEGDTYLDLAAPPGRDLRYRLTAVDDSPAANESGPSPEAEVYFAPAEEAAPVERPVFEDPGI
ncbi:MAG: hypothetical protein LBO05_07945 [Deltaproteobacteria bacterium]|nr:hypothetical protein [Deltaproteobacteria bacterium]